MGLETAAAIAAIVGGLAAAGSAAYSIYTKENTPDASSYYTGGAAQYPHLTSAEQKLQDLQLNLVEQAAEQQQAAVTAAANAAYATQENIKTLILIGGTGAALYVAYLVAKKQKIL